MGSLGRPVRETDGPAGGASDVIVVGAGPAGLYTALRLAREGCDVTVLEEHDAIGEPTHCTGIVSAETHDLYKISDDIVLNRPAECLVVAPNGEAAALRSPSEQIAVLDRGALDRSLAQSAGEAGASVATGCRVEDLEVGPRHVHVTATSGRRFRARALVLACGVTYRFHRLVGAGLPSGIAHTAQLEVDAVPADALEIHLGRSVAPEGFAWLVPIQRGGRARMKAGLLLRGDARAHLARFLATPHVRRRVIGEVGEPIRRLAPLGPTGRTYGDRVLAVGDAAGLAKPATGGGIFYSLLSAAFAAETLVDALASDRLDARRLAAYEARWRERLMPDIRTGRWFRRVLASLSDRELDAFVRALNAGDVQAVIHRVARFNWHRAVILALVQQPGIKSILIRSLFR